MRARVRRALKEAGKSVMEAFVSSKASSCRSSWYEIGLC